ncbi:DUF3278 domain-containing protein [Saliterribacillus persicus]|uniref:DUF3278 domain-containing protein n=1 Tax=Saliterribacillus persicus TaxID=930114 RepID=A0A368X9L5_9BACI|nr:DUF3278 domain-containing protein [Saliterribacillus persicus]RCW64535.1 hypothetical protein DFR57_11318 [Saliterribacillus persicus]
MKSWISFFLPNDEYKERKMLYFFSEGSIILFLSLIAMVICNYYFNISTETALLLSIAVFLFYVLGRYILSGIEYTDIATEKSYNRELKTIFIRTGSFVVIFMVCYLIFGNTPSSQNEWIEIIGFLLSVGLVWFIINFISLKRSYKRNKDLI